MSMTITISMTPAEFDKAQIALDSAAGVSHTGDEKSGTVHSPQLDFNYTFDGANFAMDITGRHGLETKIASADQIKARIKKLLNNEGD